MAITKLAKLALRAAKIAAGFALLLAGVAMIALPGPGWLTIAAGLALLASEFQWARHALDRIKGVGARAAAAFKRRRQ